MKKFLAFFAFFCALGLTDFQLFLFWCLAAFLLFLCIFWSVSFFFIMFEMIEEIERKYHIMHLGK